MSRKRQVLVINASHHDFTDAERFGELVFMTHGTLPVFDTNHMARLFEPFISDSSPEDLILLTSLNVMCCIASAMFTNRHGRLNLLIYKEGKYIERNVLFNKEKKNEKANKV